MRCHRDGVGAGAGDRGGACSVRVEGRGVHPSCGREGLLVEGVEGVLVEDALVEGVLVDMVSADGRRKTLEETLKAGRNKKNEVEVGRHKKNRRLSHLRNLQMGVAHNL
jgi:hypothetical protein